LNELDLGMQHHSVLGMRLSLLSSSTRKRPTLAPHPTSIVRRLEAASGKCIKCSLSCVLFLSSSRDGRKLQIKPTPPLIVGSFGAWDVHFERDFVLES
jgi:hypothetical protein